MRLSFVVHTLNASSGGVASATLELASALAERGHAVDLITLDGAPPAEAPPFVKIHAFGPPKNLHGFVPDLDGKLAALPRPDALFLNGLWLFSTAPFARWALRGQIPYFLFPHGMLDGYFNRFPLKYLKKLAYYLLFERHTLNHAAALLYTTTAELESSQHTFPFFAPRRQLIVGLGLRSSPVSAAEAREAFYAAFPSLAQTPFFLYLSRFHPKKAPHLLLRALPPSTALVMAGPPECTFYYTRLRHLAASKKVVWTGLLEGPVKWGALAAAQALILPSHQENFGMVVAEALSMGTPVLLSDKVALARDVAADGCALVAADTLKGTRELFERFAALSPSALSDLRAAARPSYEKRFQPATVAERLEALLFDTLQKPTQPS